MAADFCLVMGQINLVVGDVAGNVKKVIAAAEQARDELNADLVVFPELTLTGYPPEDLLLRPGLIKRVEKGLVSLKSKIKGVAVLVGHPSGVVRADLYNAASLIADGQCLASYFKHHLPNYSVFDEKRYFVEGKEPCVVDYKGIRFGITICEDIWFAGPSVQAVDVGAEIILNLNASPFSQGKWQLRETQVKQRAIETNVPIVYVNQVGGQDELVFDGCSFALSNTGEKVVRAPAWQQGLFPVLISRNENQTLSIQGELATKETELAMIYQGLVCGLQDYVEKNHFASVVIGLSGGIDSALTLALAVDALGADRVKTVMMPSRYTAQMSLDDAQQMADILGVAHSVVAIDSLFEQFVDTLSEQFAGKPADTTEENIQARVRGVILMAISNKTGAMVLSTGNKSEMAVGYSTLYGDMAGGFSPLKDVYKTLVYQLSHYRNSLSEIIPQRIITRPPSAELAPDQIDQDSLPPYEILDELLERYIGDDWSFEELVAAGREAEMVARVIRMVDRNEYKRRQAAPGIRITSRAFGRDRRYPITSGYTVTSTIE
ncbi:MAG: NAD+ synthase [Pseudomonadota bacterium]|nr:NAD+ synthase [Pseudomonadota bacterium]MDO7711934.1 NAD+ synthase [Pseudomonadota bacterium]